MPKYKRPYKRKSYRKKPSINKLVKAAVKRTEELKGIDIKFLPGGSGQDKNTANILTDMTNNSFIYTLNSIQAGSTFYQRIGKEVKLQSIKASFDIQVIWNADTVGTSPSTNGRKLRWALVWDKQPNGIVPIKSAIFATTGYTGGNDGDVFCGINYDNVGRFRILKSGTRIINCPMRQLTPSTGYNRHISVYSHFEFFQNLRDARVVYKSSDSPPTLAEIVTGGLYLVLLTDQSASDSIENGEMNLIGSIRLRYRE